ncbi:MAG: stage II sporulation protein M [Clostridia bacterium]|nr:stage II sporulation protein M [Clostridia bacterium]
MEELKRYRNAFILLTLISAAGILTGLYLYEYTGFFASLRVDAEMLPISGFDAEELLSLFFNEARILALVFMLGFTLFAPYTASLILLYKGFMTGFSAVYFGLYYQKGSIDKQSFVLICASMVFLLLVYIITGAKSIAFSGSLRYAAPDLISLLKRKPTGRYLVTFLVLCVFALISVTLKYSIPILKK